MYIILVYMSPLSTYTFIFCLGRQIVSWPRQGSQNSLEKPRLMEDQQEFQEEVLDFMGFGSCMPREAWRLPSPQPLQKNSADAKATKAV